MPDDPIRREAAVTAAFCAWLADAGWSVETEVDWVDVVARRGDEVLVAEVKGVTSSPGLDVDTMYGQILRRMDLDSGARYAVVVPQRASSAALRVGAGVRNVLRLTIFTVDEDGNVIEAS